MKRKIHNRSIFTGGHKHLDPIMYFDVHRTVR